MPDAPRRMRRTAADAGLEVAGSVMASDAFFPFRDGIDTAAKAGVSAVIQPGGSIRDDEVIAAANDNFSINCIVTTITNIADNTTAASTYVMLLKLGIYIPRMKSSINIFSRAGLWNHGMDSSYSKVKHYVLSDTLLISCMPGSE